MQIRRDSLSPPEAARALAIVSVGMYDSISASSRSGNGPRAAPDAIVSGAAQRSLSYLFPARRRHFAGVAGNLTGTGARARRGLRLGSQVAEELVRRARKDGSTRPWFGEIPNGPGVWVLGASGGPLNPSVARWRPWNFKQGAVPRSLPPPPFGSARYERQVKRVYEASQELTPRQRAVALKWADGAGTITPPGHWSRIAARQLTRVDGRARSAALTLAALNTAQADAFIACWSVKYRYWTERPETAIRRFDPSWEPLVPTPPFPGYVSGHSTTSAASAKVLGAIFSDRAEEMRRKARGASRSRLFGGIHFPADNHAGLHLGAQVGTRAVRAALGD